MQATEGSSAQVVVLGGTGMFGVMATRVLADQARVVALSRTSGPPFEVASSEAVLRDVMRPDGGTIVNAVGALAPRFAAETCAERADAIEANAVFPHRLTAVAQDAGWRVIHISTDAVFGRLAGEVSEEALPVPDDDYGRSKLLGEPASDSAIILRTSIVGPSPIARRGLWEWVLARQPDEDITGFDDQEWSGCTTLQLAEVCGRLLDPRVFTNVRAAGPVVHIAPIQRVTKLQLVQQLAALVRPDLRVVPRASGLPVSRRLASRHPRCAELLGSPLSLRDALERTAAMIPRLQQPT